MDERASDVLPEEHAVEGRREIEIEGKRSSGGTDTGGVRAELGEDKGRYEDDVNRNINVGDQERREIVLAGVIGTRKIEYGGSAVGFRGDGGEDRPVE